MKEIFQCRLRSLEIWGLSLVRVVASAIISVLVLIIESSKKICWKIYSLQYIKSLSKKVRSLQHKWSHFICIAIVLFSHFKKYIKCYISFWLVSVFCFRFVNTTIPLIMTRKMGCAILFCRIFKMGSVIDSSFVNDINVLISTFLFSTW